MHATALKTKSHNVLRAKRRVLIVEDEPDVSQMLAYNLQRAGFDTQEVFDGRNALDAVASDPPDLVILDWMIPSIPGTEVATRIRTNPVTAHIPIVMLTAKTDELDQVVGLTVGADDYITKPFSIKVLLARLEAVLRRQGEPAAAGASLCLGPLSIDTARHAVTLDGAPVHLTLTEFRILAALVQANGRVLTRSQLMARAMGPGVMVTERTIDVHMTAIRRKLGPHADLVRTARGVGYQVVVPGSES